jgi:hypothetical protein
MFALALVPAMMLSGMMQRAPGVFTESSPGTDPASALASPEHPQSDYAETPEEHADGPAIDGHGGRCQQPTIGCDCSDCLSYFDAHSLTLAAIVAGPQRIPRPALHNNDVIAPMVGMDLSPPTPPPRS